MSESESDDWDNDEEEEGLVLGSEIVEINKVTEKPPSLDLKRVSTAVCRIKQKTGSGTNWGTGFLCEFNQSNGIIFKGLFTCKHVLKWCGEFVLEFEESSGVFTVKPEDVQWMIDGEDNELLDFTFISFQNPMLEKLQKPDRKFLFVSKSPFPSGSETIHVTIIQHPNGGKLSASQGNAKKKPEKLSYKASTQPGSSGSPILNDEGDVIGIHKKSGKSSTITNYVKKNFGTIITNVLQKISDKEPWKSSRWNPENVDEIDSKCLVPVSLENLYSLAKSFCTLKLNSEYLGNGFLCCVKLSEDLSINGILTSSHVLLRLPFSKSFELDFFNRNSVFKVLPRHINWIYPNLEHHFTFIALHLSVVKNMKTEQRSFLELAEKKPAAGETFYLLQQEKGKEVVQYQGLLNECHGIYLRHERAGLPNVHGSPILNDQYKVIGIGHKCGPSQQLGTCITLDIVRCILREPHQRKSVREAVLVESFEEETIRQPAASVCKVNFSYLKEMSFTGFLCTIKNRKKAPLKGLMTSCQISIQEKVFLTATQRKKIKEGFVIYFDANNLTVNVEPANMKGIFLDVKLDFIFIQFDDTFVKHIEDLHKVEKYQELFLSECEGEPSIDSSIYVLHHPNGDKVSVSKGSVKNYVNEELQHLSDTQSGSVGGPILNEDFKVIGIHKGIGPLDKTGGPEYKTGTRMQYVARKILDDRANSTG